MDKGTILGVAAGTGLVLVAILMGSGLGTFWSTSSVLIVAGGTVAALGIAFPTRELKLVVKVMRRVFREPGDEASNIIQFLIKCLQASKKDGPLALEGLSGKAPIPAISKGLRLIADGTDSRTIHEIMTTEQKYVEEYHRVGQKIFNEAGKYSPAFGMVGTLIGLVQMLAGLDDPSTIGPKMAVALLTTFYGAILANLVFLPMVTKLERRIKIEISNIQLAIVGLMAINADLPIGIMREKMNAFLAEQEGEGKAKGDGAKEAEEAA